MIRKKDFVISLLAIVVQYYDYHLLGFVAAKVGKVFFPIGDTSTQLLRIYFIIAISVLAKPIGSIILGKIGDIHGRSVATLISLIIISLASFVIALTPDYQEIGIKATISLLVTRMLITGSVSSSTDGIRIFIYEKIGRQRQCFGEGLATAASMTGSLVASLSAWLFTLDYFSPNGWRIALAIGGVITFIMTIILKLSNSYSYNYIKQEKDYQSYKYLSIFKIIANNIKLFIKIIIISGAIGSTYQFNIMFFGTYIFAMLKLIPASVMQLYTSLGIGTYIVFAIIGGIIADNYSRKLLAITAGFGILIVSVFSTYLISQGEFNLFLYLLSNALLACFTTSAHALLKDNTPMVIRYRIYSFAHSIGSMLFSAPTAFWATYLYQATKLSWTPMLYFTSIVFMMLFAIIKLINIKLN